MTQQPQIDGVNVAVLFFQRVIVAGMVGMDMPAIPTGVAGMCNGQSMRHCAWSLFDPLGMAMIRTYDSQLGFKFFLREVPSNRQAWRMSFFVIG